MRSIARVSAERDGEESEGTAFHIGNGFMLTALHVVADPTRTPLRPPTSITLRFGSDGPIRATLLDGFWDAAADWAVLRCDATPDVPALDAVKDIDRKAEWETFGFPDFHAEGKTLTGEVSNPNGSDEGVPAIELFCKELSGRGPASHGLSGAPCLVGGKVAGIIRTTATGAFFDGKQVRHLITEAGTLFATPAKAVIARQVARRISKLPGTWAPPEGTSKEFVTYLSSAAANVDSNRELSLETVTENAHEGLTDLVDPPAFVSWESVFKSPDAFLANIPVLCRAKIVILDATDFEPAMMLMAGIRAVVRRGITILSVGRDYALGDVLRVPFNVTDANIVSHSGAQGRRGVDPVHLLRQRLRQGLQELELSIYQDNPVYEAIRRLPAERRGLIPRDEGVLVLCPFKEPYNTEIWAHRLLPSLENQLELLNGGRQLGRDALGVARSFELNSARLVSQALYETIRRAQACVVDLTLWSPNVLFELGVRIAATRQRTSCLLATNWTPPQRADGREPDEGIRRQCERIAALFVPDPDGRYDPARPWPKELAYRSAYGPRSASPFGLADGSVHAAITDVLDIDAEPASRPVYRELMESAEFFGRLEGEIKPVGLYPANEDLLRREEAAEFGRLIAAWLYVYFRPLEGDDPGEAAAAAKRIGLTLRARHLDRLRELKASARQDRWAGMLDELLRSDAPATVKTEAMPPIGFDQIAELKKQAIALKKTGDFEQSLRILDRVIEQLPKISALDGETARRIQVELADAYGMKGGVYRRHSSLAAHLDLALDAYRKGLKIERVLKHSTYNRSNAFVLTIAHERRPLDAELREDLDSVIRDLERETQGPRSDEFYAWADLAQFYLLRGDSERAKEAYRRARDQGPGPDQIRGHVEVLRLLAEGIAGTAPETARRISVTATNLETGAEL